MSSRKATFYIDEHHRSFVAEFQEKNDLNSPSEALRKIIENADKHPPIDEAELEVLSRILKENTERARYALSEAFSEIESTKRFLRSHDERH